MSVRLITAAAVISLLAGLPHDAHASDKKGKKHAKHERQHVSDRDATRVAVDVQFGPVDIRVIRSHYRDRYRSLPPGLRKKVARGGQLPPGWRKKFEPFPATLDGRLRPLPRGYQRGVLDGHAVIYDSRSHVIIDVAVLF